MSKVRFTPPQEYDSSPRVLNTNSGAVHVAFNEQETVCGTFYTNDRYKVVESVMISCQACLGRIEQSIDFGDKYDRLYSDPDGDIDPLGIIGDDESDGVFHAMRWEIYGQ